MDVQKDHTFTHFPADPTRSGHVPRTLRVGKEAGSDASICFTWKGNLFLEHVQMGALPGLFARPPVVLLMLAQRGVVVLDPLKQFASHCRGIRFDVLPLLQVAFERRAATWGIGKTEDGGSGTEEDGRGREG